MKAAPSAGTSAANASASLARSRTETHSAAARSAAAGRLRRLRRSPRRRTNGRPKGRGLELVPTPAWSQRHRRPTKLLDSARSLHCSHRRVNRDKPATIPIRRRSRRGARQRPAGWSMSISHRQGGNCARRLSNGRIASEVGNVAGSVNCLKSAGQPPSQRVAVELWPRC